MRRFGTKRVPLILSAQGVEQKTSLKFQKKRLNILWYLLGNNESPGSPGSSLQAGCWIESVNGSRRTQKDVLRMHVS